MVNDGSAEQFMFKESSLFSNGRSDSSILNLKTLFSTAVMIHRLILWSFISNRCEVQCQYSQLKSSVVILGNDPWFFFVPQHKKYFQTFVRHLQISVKYRCDLKLQEIIKDKVVRVNDYRIYLIRLTNLMLVWKNSVAWL